MKVVLSSQLVRVGVVLDPSRGLCLLNNFNNLMGVYVSLIHLWQNFHEYIISSYCMLFGVS